MRYRKLRIAWTVFCVIAAVLLIELWVRSYKWLDKCSWQAYSSPIINCSSYRGRVLIETANVTPGPTWAWGWHTYSRYRDKGHVWELAIVEDYSPYGFLSKAVPAGHVVVFPHWLMILVFTALAAAPWIRLRFTLRTLLIVTTLVAVVLGLIVYSAHR